MPPTPAFPGPTRRRSGTWRIAELAAAIALAAPLAVAAPPLQIDVQRDGEVRLAYDARFELAEPLPPVIGPLLGTLAMRSAIRTDFEALIREIERRRAAVPRIEWSR